MISSFDAHKMIRPYSSNVNSVGQYREMIQVLSSRSTHKERAVGVVGDLGQGGADCPPVEFRVSGISRRYSSSTGLSAVGGEVAQTHVCMYHALYRQRHCVG